MNIKHRRIDLLDVIVMLGIGLFLLSFFIQALDGVAVFLLLNVDGAKNILPVNYKFYTDIFDIGEDIRNYSIIFAGIGFMILFIKKRK